MEDRPQFVKPNGLFGPLPRKRAFKPNSLFFLGNKRNIKPNGLFLFANKRSFKPNGLFGALEKRGVDDFWATIGKQADEDNTRGKIENSKVYEHFWVNEGEEDIEKK